MRDCNGFRLLTLLGAFLLLCVTINCSHPHDDDPDQDGDEDVGVDADAGDVGVDIDADDVGVDADAGDADAGDGIDTDTGDTDTDDPPCGDCSKLDDQCNIGVCDEETETCVAEPANVGESCYDGLVCTVDETCTEEGTCVGEPKDCSHLDGLCRSGVCRENAEGCVAIDKSEKFPCDTGQHCVVDEKCTLGECVGEPRDCSHLDDGECHEGHCDESLEKCVKVDRCDGCEAGLPIADIDADSEVTPNTVVNLDGSGSYDPEDQDLSYKWRLYDRPDPSSAVISEPTSATPSLLADVSGEFEVCLTVENEQQCTSEETCTTITVKPQVDLHVELTWRLDADPAEEPIDLDLHYLLPGGTWFDGYQELPCRDPDNQADAVWWCAPNPDWGGGEDGNEPNGIPEYDPLLDVDNLVGDGPENINQERLFDGEGFRVAVHNFRDHGHGPDEARVRIFVDGELQFEAFETIECGMFWQVAELDITGDGTEVEIHPLDEEHFEGPVGYCGD